MRFFIYIFLSLFSAVCSGQQLLPVYYDTNYSFNEFTIEGAGEYSATSLQNEFMKTFIQGGYIDGSMKDAAFNKHRSANFIGGDFNSEFCVSLLRQSFFQQEKYGLFFKVGYQSIGSAVYTKDLFGLTFYGNEKYLDQIASFSNTEFKFVTAQKLGFGVVNKKSKSSLTLNYYNIENFYAGMIHRGILYQDSQSNTDSLAINGILGGTTGKQFNKGFGFGIDVNLKLKIDWFKDQFAYIQITGKDIGFATVQSGANYYQLDSTYAFSGYKIADLIAQNSSFSDSTSFYEKIGVEKSFHRTNFFLPSMFQIGKIIDEYNPSKFQSFFGVKIYPTLSYTPLIYVGMQYKISSSLRVGIQESYGGFTNFRTGIYCSFLYKKTAIGVGSENLVGALSKKGNGQSLILRLQCRI